MLLWAGSALIAVAAHAGVVAWALREPVSLPREDAAPAAVMIELAAIPVAPEAVEEQITPDLLDAPEVPEQPPSVEPPRLHAAVPDEPAPEAPPDRAEPEAPVEPEVPADPVMTAPPAEAPPSEFAASRPRARPENLPPPSPPAEPQRVERQRPPEQPQPPSQAARRAQVQAPPAETAAAPESSRGSAGAVSPAQWQSRLLAHLERRKRYPDGARRRGAEGVAQVRFAIDDAGNVLSAQLVRSSGHAELDAESLAMIQRASPVPAPPPGAPRDITAPVAFTIR